jgi:hypothetical protein
MYKVMGEFVLWAHSIIGTLTYRIGVTKGYAYYLLVKTKQTNRFWMILKNGPFKTNYFLKFVFKTYEFKGDKLGGCQGFLSFT